MLRNQFDPKQPYSYIRYGRMSDPKQNKSSPDQQFQTIETTLSRCGYRNWKLLKSYQDDWVSGKLERKRAGFQQLLLDIKSGFVSLDLILVDDIDRFGRMDRLSEIRRELYNKYGVLILDAKSGFVDPQGTQGRVYSAFEEIRATEEGRTKAHRVFRGKRDAVQKRKWPGGKPPFGFKLKLKRPPIDGDEAVHRGSVLIPDPDTAWIVRKIFELADQKGWGQTLLARHLNASVDIPDQLKPFEESTVGSWIENELYKGLMIWPKVATDVKDDRRVIEKVPEEEQIKVEDYCPAIVPPELYDRVREVRQARAGTKQRDKKSKQKLLKAPAPGATLKYPLSGLVRCRHCQASMIASGSSVYKTKDGENHRYVSYRCTGARTGLCVNTKSVPERWLGEKVLESISESILPDYKAGKSLTLDELLNADWFTDLRAAVQKELEELVSTDSYEPSRWELELHEIREKIKGWNKTLSDPKLPASIRDGIYAEYQRAVDCEASLESELKRLGKREEYLAEILNPVLILHKLNRLAETLGGQNATRLNLELSLIIDSIICSKSGEVTLKICRLGPMGECMELLRSCEATNPCDSTDHADCYNERQVKPRRRAKLVVDTLGEDGRELDAAAVFAADPNRFAGMPDRWFTEYKFHIPTEKYLYQLQAKSIAQRRLEGLTHVELANEFGVTVPTIRKSLTYAKAKYPELSKLPRKMPRARWHEVYALEVEAKKAEGMGTNDLVKFFGKSDTTIRKALEHAEINPSTETPE